MYENASRHFSVTFSLSAFSRPFAFAKLAGYIGAKDDGSGGDNCMEIKAPVKLSPPTNQHPTFYRPDPVAHPTASKHRKE